jgi:hypothetical protein
VVERVEAEKTEHNDSPVRVVEQVPAEEILAAAQEAPKAMAAAAAADGGSASVPATDASTIANIVDSMLADLRPKLMEEIAKKMAGK